VNSSNQVPDPEVPARARTRTYSAAYKARILEEYDGLDKAGKGALLRREGLYTSLISAWRQQRDEAALAALAKPAGRPPADPVERENAKLRKDVERLRYTSYHTGRPRTVLVRYPRNPLAFTPAKIRVLSSILVLLFWICLGSSLVVQFGGLPAAVTVTVAAVGALHVTRSVYRLVRAVVDVRAPVTRTGRVLAIHPWDEQSDSYQLVALDDGRHHQLQPWLFAADDMEGIKVGDVVQVHGQRWTRRGDRIHRTY
jgi:transposase-like protein